MDWKINNKILKLEKTHHRPRTRECQCHSQNAQGCLDLTGSHQGITRKRPILHQSSCRQRRSRWNAFVWIHHDDSRRNLEYAQIRAVSLMLRTLFATLACINLLLLTLHEWECRCKFCLSRDEFNRVLEILPASRDHCVFPLLVLLRIDANDT